MAESFTIEYREAEPEELAVHTARALKRLPEDWLDQILSLYGQGCSDAEVMRELNMRPGDFRQLIMDTESCNFAEVVEIGRMLSRAWWERLGRMKISSKDINVALYNLQMQNRFGWTTKSEESKTNIEIQSKDSDELDNEIRQHLTKIGIK